MKKQRLRKYTLEDMIMDPVILVVMAFIAIVTIYPFYYCVVLAFNNGVDATLGGIYFFPRKPTADNFVTLLADASWGRAIAISVLRTTSGTLLGLFVTSIVAYALSFEKLIFSKTYHKLYILTMYVSGGLIPFYIVLRGLGLINTFGVYIIPGMLNVYFMLIMINFYKTIPASLYEAAWMDGANDMTVFIKVALPLSKAPLAAVALFFAVNQWNSWIDSVYYVTKDHLRPMSYLMMQIINKSATASSVTNAQSMGYAASALQSTTTSLQMAAMVLAVAPILAIYPFLQQYFVKGIMIGSVKE